MSRSGIHMADLKARKQAIIEDIMVACKTRNRKQFHVGDKIIQEIADKYISSVHDDADVELVTGYVWDVFEHLTADGRIVTTQTESGPGYRAAFREELREALRLRVQLNAKALGDISVEELRRHFEAHRAARPRRTERLLHSTTYPIKSNTVNNQFARWVMKNGFPFLYHKRRLWFYEDGAWKTFAAEVKGSVMEFYEKA